MSTTSMASRGTALITNLPESRNRYFVGRRELLGNLERAFTNPAAKNNTQVIIGKSGAGKTATALEYAFSRQQLYDLIWFIRAESPANIAADVAKLTAWLSPASEPEVDFQSAARAMRRALQLRDRWLLIFDDAQSTEEISACLPWGSKGNVLITSRKNAWKPLADPIVIPPWTRADSVSFLELHFPEMRYRSIADKLALALSDLPMALEQAAAYIKQAQITPEDYLKAYEAQWAETLPRSRPGAEFPDATALAWELSFRQLSKNNPAAADLLTLCSFLGAEQIPYSMITEAREHLPKSLLDLVVDPLAPDPSVYLLQEYSLARVSEQSLTVHDLTASLTRQRLTPDDRAKWAGIAMAVAANAFPFDSQTPALWPRCGQALPHVLQSAAHVQEAGISTPQVAELLDRAGCFLLKQAQYDQAREVLETALRLVHDKIGASSTTAARVANNLGRVRQRLGDSTGAMALFESAMEIDALRYGPTTPYMATAANNFGMTLAATGQPQRARERFEWALKIFTSHYGEKHLKIASVLNNLGYVLAELKLPREADDCYRRAMFIVESLHGEHPNLACIALNLGCLLRSQSQMTEARQLLDLAVQIDETSLGKNHPRIAYDLGKLAQYHDDCGDHALSIQALERARQIIESNYGPDSSLQIPYLKQLAQSLKANSDVEGAAVVARRIFELETKPQASPAPADESAGVDDGVLSE